MATRYLLGRGELLTYPIAAPKKEPGEKNHPYGFEEAKQALLPQIYAANQAFEALPKLACPDDLAVAIVTLHPAYIAKSYFPQQLFDMNGLQAIGSRNQRVRPRKRATKSAPLEADTTQIFVAGTRPALRSLLNFTATLTPEAEGPSMQIAQIEAFTAMQPLDRVRVPTKKAKVFEVGLHVPQTLDPSRVRSLFANYAASCNFGVRQEFQFEAGRLMFLAVEGPQEGLEELARFTLMRMVRAMPRIRGARPMTRSQPIAVGFQLPDAEPLTSDFKVAVLDGGLPNEHILEGHVRRYFLADEDADDVGDYLNHGLGVTSALLFGAVEPGEQAARAYASVDVHRVLDARSDAEDPYELYRTLGAVETVLLSRQYPFVNLSLGPDLCIEEGDVHAWTAVIDELLSDGDTLMTVAIGNNGERDAEAALNRIQVPADCVNALSVGAVDRTDDAWRKAAYSAVGPGRSPGRRKPDLVAFGGSGKEYFHVVAPGAQSDLVATLGTSFAAPLALRSAVGIRAILGDALTPLAIKALLIHGCRPHDTEGPAAVGWGRVPSDLNSVITCGDGFARIVYQGKLSPGKFLRAPVPLPASPLEGTVKLSATFCYASPVDPQDACSYTKAGLGITFRPHSGKLANPEAGNPKSNSFFPANLFRTEAEQRADLHKWETVLHATKGFRGSSLRDAAFDVHYNAREGGGPTSSKHAIPYALVVTLSAPRHANLYEQILQAHTVLQAITPVLSVPLQV